MSEIVRSSVMAVERLAARTNAGATPAATETHRPIRITRSCKPSSRRWAFATSEWFTTNTRYRRTAMKGLWRPRSRNRNEGCRFSIGLRNSHDKSMRLAMTWAIACLCARTWHSRGTLLPYSPNTRSLFADRLASRLALIRMQRNFEPMRKQVEAWQRSELTDVTAKVVIYEAFVEGRLEAPKHSPAACMISTSSPSTRNSVREPSGVSPMRSRRHSRNWIHPAVPGDGQAGRIPGSPILTIV